jgi:hypothetical protein
METLPMRPAKPDHAEQPDMFRETLEAILDPRHELLELGRRIDWAALDAVSGEPSSTRSAGPTCRRG